MGFEKVDPRSVAPEQLGVLPGFGPGSQESESWVLTTVL